MIRSKADEGHSARLTAGFCWPWSDPEPDGTLVTDVKVGAWQMPWNARPEAGRLAPGIPPSNFWASDPNGINQVGCVYTAQGFEFDYVGVIWGRDLRWDPASETWIGDSGASHDSIVKRSGDRFTDLVKRTYRVPSPAASRAATCTSRMRRRRIRSGLLRREGEQDTAGVWASGPESVTSAFAAPALVIGPIKPVRVRIRDVVADADHRNPLRIHVRAIEVR